tara:strand:- start:379 stop:1026 length:648 start_codon:yes stop_codon:yes gene_type:complete
MASVKEYAYFVKGDFIRLVERDVNFDNDPNSKLYGPGVDRGQWKSPLSDVTDGLEIEYTYTPSYRINDASDVIAISAYTENSGLLQLTLESITVIENQWILITGSEKWNGLHQVNAGTTGTSIVLKTKYNGIAVTESSRLSQDISVMEDEGFEIDLPHYLIKALEYYLKAQLIEDAGQIEMKEYYLKEFRKQVEKHATSRSWGMRTMTAGPHAIR